MKFLIKVGASAFFLLLASFSIYLYIFDSPNVRSNHILFIPTGAEFNQVLDSIRYQNMLKSNATFHLASRLMKYHKLVKPGRYEITSEMSNKEVISLLRSGMQAPVLITFHNISFFEELSHLLSKKLEPDSGTFSRYFLTKETAAKYGFTKETFALMFLPDTYQMFWNTNPEKFAERMYKEYGKFWNEERKSQARKIGLDPIKAGILASIVESETKKADELPVVAGLYLNRLRKGMLLQADPTVVFATQLERGVRSKRLYFKDLKIESPYNTYIYKGLPPGPISFPSKLAIEAVLNPSDHNFLYMCADPERPGYHLFTDDYRQHLRNASRYHRWISAQQIN